MVYTTERNYTSVFPTMGFEQGDLREKISADFQVKIKSKYFFWNQVGEADEGFPMRAGGREAAIESAIEDQVLLQAVREGKECADGIRAD